MFESVLREAIERHKNLPVVVSAGANASYADLAASADLRLKELRALGCSEGDAIVARAGSGLGFLALMLAALRAGYVFIPFAPNIPWDRVEAVAKEFSAAVIADESATGKISLRANSNRESSSRYRELFKSGGFVRYTSGTTGSAKGVFVSHAAALARAQSADAGLKIPYQARVAWPLQMALHFVAVLPVVLLRGGAFCFAEGGSAAALRRVVEEAKVNVIYGAPLHYELLAATPAKAHVLSRALSTTAPISSSAAERFQSAWNARVDQVYGIFELGIVSAQDDASRRGVGKLMPGVQVSIRDENGSPVAAGEQGKVFVASPGALNAYLTPLSTRDQILKSGWFETGDVGSISHDGQLILHGRATSVINVAGAKIYPEQVEEALLSVPGVVAARAFGRAHAELGSIVCAEVVLADGVALNEPELRRVCRAKLDRYAVPQNISQVAQIPFSENGKIKRFTDDVTLSAERGNPAAA